MDRSSNLFSYCVGGFALISTLVSIAVFSRGYLPIAQMKILTEILDETRSIYEKAEADQLLPDEVFRREVQKDLKTFEGAATTLRVMAYESTSLKDEYLAAINGLSHNIIQLSIKVKKFRSLLLSTTEKGRQEQQRRSVDETPEGTSLPCHDSNRQSVAVETEVAETAAVPSQDSQLSIGSMPSFPNNTHVQIHHASETTSTMEANATNMKETDHRRPSSPESTFSNSSTLVNDRECYATTEQSQDSKSPSPSLSWRRYFRWWKGRSLSPTTGSDVGSLPV